MQIVQIVGGLGTPAIRPPTAAESVQFLRGVIAELRAAPAEEFAQPGVKGSTMIHVPEAEGGSFGKFVIEWDTSEVQQYQRARDTVIAAIQAAIGQSDVKRLLMAANALPALDPVLEVAARLATRLENMIAVYEAEVLKKKKKTPVLLIAGIGLTVFGLGAITWAATRKKTRRR